MRKNLLVKIMYAALVLTVTGCGNTGDSSSLSSGNKEDSISSGSGDSKELITVRTGVMTNNADQWYYVVGKETGIYEKYGLDVEATEYAAGIHSVDAMVTGQIDIGHVADFAGVNRIGSTASQTDLRYFASSAHSESSNNQLYVNPDKVTDLASIKGKNITTLLGTVWEYWNARTVEAAGLSPHDVKYKAVDSAQDGLAIAKSGDSDAFWASGENAKRLEEYGWKPIVSLGDLNLGLYQYYMSTEDYLSNNNDTVVKFLKATQEIMDYMANDVDGTADIIYKATGLAQDIYKNSYESTEFGVLFDQNAYDDINNINIWAFQNGYYDNEYKTGAFIDTKALEEAFPDKVSWKAQ